tara:strand:- start:534 stop:752 length:219 start_codon:yes stop_codon:yes gene_type:complete
MKISFLLFFIFINIIFIFNTLLLKEEDKWFSSQVCIPKLVKYIKNKNVYIYADLCQGGNNFLYNNILLYKNE